VKTVEIKRIKFIKAVNHFSPLIVLNDGTVKSVDQMSKFDWRNAQGAVTKKQYETGKKDITRRRKLVRRSKKMAVYF